MTQRAGHGGRSRTSAWVHTSLLTALVLVVATVALVVRAPSPPSIAEFAPQAVKQIQRAPQDQSSQFGNGGSGSCLGRAPCAHRGSRQGPGAGTHARATTPPPTQPPGGRVIDVARVHQCFGDPPRQIEDPQSPPCVPYWKGDNGGATWKGVTGTTITVAYPNGLGTLSREEEDTVNFFNDRFELYGRKIVLKPFGTGLFTTATPTSMQAGAVQVDKEIGAFASLGYNAASAQGQDAYYYDELAQRHILSVESDDSFRTEADNYDRPGLEGYEWTFLPSLDKLEANVARYVCTSLAGKAPAYAGSPISAQQTLQAPTTRKFGVLQQVNYSTGVNIDALKAGLAACNIDPDVKQIEVNATDPQNQGVAAQFANDGVTTVICVCFRYTVTGIQKGAQAVQYQPEWMVVGNPSAIDDVAGNPSIYPQVAHTFGIYGFNKINPTSQEPWFWAVKAEDPSQDAASQVNPASLGYFLTSFVFYQSMLLLASGIQLAGPNLTPQSFRDGLMGATFPNPGAAGPPYYQSTVGFGPGDHSMMQDVALGYWDATVRSQETGTTPTFCLVGRGARWTADSWRPVPESKLHPGGGRPPSEPCP